MLGPVWTGAENFAATMIRSLAKALCTKEDSTQDIMKMILLETKYRMVDNHAVTKRWCPPKVLVVDGGESTALGETDRARN